MRKDTKKYIYELINRALMMEKIIKAIPKQKYYEQSSEYFKRLEYRNESLNKAVEVLRKEVGINLQELRVHQADARYIYAEVKEFLLENSNQNKAV